MDEDDLKVNIDMSVILKLNFTVCNLHYSLRFGYNGPGAWHIHRPLYGGENVKDHTTIPSRQLISRKGPEKDIEGINEGKKKGNFS